MQSDKDKSGHTLVWPQEITDKDARFNRWEQPGSNICLDFHGDPATADLVIYSDGNHHMALLECLDLFQKQNDGVKGVFYATTPPGPIVQLLKIGGLQLGNIVISRKPHVFISPPSILDKLVADGLLSEHNPFVKNQGNVLLVKKGNPKQITTVSDFMREDVRLFLSNSETEKASFSAYYETLKAQGGAIETGGEAFPDNLISQGRVLFGSRIHHREAPQAVADGSADVAVVFYHLALRYIRIFPDVFDAIPLGGSMEKPEPLPGNVVSLTHAGIVGDGGAWGKQLVSFLKSDTTMDIYCKHGLLPL